MDDLLPELAEALRSGPDTLCVEIDLSATPPGSLHSSNNSYFVPLSLATAQRLLCWLKERACLDPVAQNLRQSGVLSVGAQLYRLNCCPQVGGEIVTLHRPYSKPPPIKPLLEAAAHVPISAPSWLSVGEDGSPTNPVTPSSGHTSQKPGLLHRLIRRFFGSRS